MCGLSQRSVASMMPAMRAVPKAAVAWFALVGSFLLALAIVDGGQSVPDAPEDFIARGFHDLFQTAAVVGGGLDLTAAVLT
jgi:hypothetical protein